MSKKKLYEALGAEPSDSKETIKAKHRRRAKECHPDKRPGDAAAVDEFKLITRAMEVLLDDDRRKRYDETGDDEQIEPIIKPALNMLSNLMHQIIQADLQAGRMPQSRELVKDLTGVLKSNLAGCTEEIESLTSTMAALQDIADRFATTNGSENLLASLAKAPLRDIKDKIGKIELKKCCITEALAIVASHKFKRMVREQTVTVHCGGTSTATSTIW